MTFTLKQTYFTSVREFSAKGYTHHPPPFGENDYFPPIFHKDPTSLNCRWKFSPGGLKQPGEICVKKPNENKRK